ncbi:MAG: PKD domain-containing protein [Bacteroidota bacterium]
MISKIKKVVFFFSFILFPFFSYAQLIINEISQGPSGAQEYVELLVVGTPGCSSIPCMDLRGYYIDDNNGNQATGTGTGIAQGCVRFKNVSFWSCIPIGTLIVIYNDADMNASIPSDDISITDGNCKLVIPVSNCTFFEVNTALPSTADASYPTTGFAACGSWSNLAMANGDDSFQTITPTGTPVFSVSWGNNSLNPIIYFSGTSSATVSYMANTVNDNPNSQSNWTRVATAGNQTPGAANNSDNAAWISSMNNSCTALTPLVLATNSTNATCSCDGTATVTASGSNGPYTYSWAPSGGTTSTATALCAGTYTVTVSSASGCIQTASVTITAGSGLTVGVNSETICAGQTAALTATGASSYVWSTGATTSSITVSPNSDASYTVTGSNGGCSGNAVAMVTVGGALAITVNSETICSGQTATLTASGATTYVWSTGSTDNSITENPASTDSYTVTGTSGGCSGTAVATVTVGSGLTIIVNSATICTGQTAVLTASGAATYVWSTGSTANSITVSPSSIASYTVTGTSGGCSGTAIANVTVANALTITVNSATICTGQTATLTANGGTSYVWSTGSSGNSITVSPSSVTSYTVTGSNGGCSGTAIASVTVGNALAVNVNSATICAGEDAILTASGGVTYVWSTGSTANSITDSPAATASYTVTGSDGGCTGTAVGTVTVGNALAITVNSETICAGQNATLSASGGVTYIWSTGSTDNSIIISPVITESYTVTGTNNGCSGSATGVITVNPLPDVAFNGNILSGCEPFCTDFTDVSSTTGGIITNWHWDFGGNGVSDIQHPQHCFSTPGQYSITLSVSSDLGCSASFTITDMVVLEPFPVAEFTIPLTIGILDPNVSFVNNSFGASSWNWDFGDSFDSINNSSVLENPVHTYSEAGDYCATLAISNNAGCVDTSQVCFVIKPEFTFYIPNSFSPNADGKNDEFYGRGENIKEYEMSIYDQWGDKIFFTKNINEPWNGLSNKGSGVSQQDVYVYDIVVKDNKNERYQYTGNVTLLR